MCGIVGIYNAKHKVNPSLLARARDALSHRGPDGCGTWLSTDQHVGLAHSRLSIRDIPGGAQPILNRDHTIAASVNGEFYEYSKLRKSLEQKGYVFNSNSDSELVIHLYEEYNLEFVHYLRGEFAFVLYDQRNHKMVIARDRFGIKPLCYFHSNDGLFYVASEAKALFALGITARWNEYALSHAFSFQYIPPDQTLFKDIQQVPAGHLMIYDGKSLRNQPYWDLDFPTIDEQQTTPFATLSTQLDIQLREAIQLRLPTEDINFCCHLSGGIDSATIAALASELTGKSIPCFSVAFPHQDYNEIQFAENLAKKIGSPFHPILIDATDMTDVLSDAVYYSEGLAINNHLSAKYILNREIKTAGFKVALSGEGSDELFAGYLHLQQDYLPQEITENIACGIHITNDETLPLNYLQQQLGFVPTFIKAKAAIGHKLYGLLDNLRFSPEQIEKDLLNNSTLYKKIANLHPVNQATYLWIKYALTGYILKTLGDGCEMAHGIEGRVPFLDHHLFNFSKKIPLSMKIKPNTDKFILRETVKNYLTTEIIERKKQPFIAPPFSLLNNKKGYEYMCDSLKSCDNLPFLNSKKINLYLGSIPKKSVADQIAAEPVLMLILTAKLLGQRYGM